MATKLGSLLIELGLDSAKFRSGTRQAQREMNVLQRGIASSAGLIKAAVSGMLAGLTVDLFAQIIKSGLDYASSLGEVAQQLGVTTKTLQEYRYAATQVGISQEEMDNGLARLTRSMGQAVAGSKAQIQAFESLGINIREFVSSGRDAGDLLPLIANGLKGMQTAAQRAAVETAIFGKAGQKLDTLLAGGADQINNLRDAANRLGVVLSDRQIQNADDTADKLAAVQTVLQARIAGVVAENSSSIIQLANSLASLTERAIQSAASLLRWIQVHRAMGTEMNNAANAVQPLPGETNAQTLARRRAAGRAAADRRSTVTSSWFGGLINFRSLNAEQPEDRQASTRPITPRNTPRTAPIELPAIPSISGGGRSRGGGGSGISDAAREARREVEERRRALASLLDQLNPVAAAQRELAENTKLLKDAMTAGQISLEQYRIGLAALNREYGLFGEGITDWREVIGDVAEGVAVDVPSTDEILGDLADHWEAQSERMTAAAERQQQALFDTLGSIRNFASSLKSGDIVGIFESVLGLLEGIGGITGGFKIGGMQFGTGASSRIPGFANGTNFAPGGLAWVGERGRELVNLPRGSQVVPNHELSGMGGAQVQVIPSPYFDVVVNGHIQTAAPGIASQGSQGAQIAMARRGSRRLA